MQCISQNLATGIEYLLFCIIYIYIHIIYNSIHISPCTNEQVKFYEHLETHQLLSFLDTQAMTK